MLFKLLANRGWRGDTERAFSFQPFSATKITSTVALIKSPSGGEHNPASPLSSDGDDEFVPETPPRKNNKRSRLFDINSYSHIIAPETPESKLRDKAIQDGLAVIRRAQNSTVVPETPPRLMREPYRVTPADRSDYPNWSPSSEGEWRSGLFAAQCGSDIIFIENRFPIGARLHPNGTWDPIYIEFDTSPDTTELTRDTEIRGLQCPLPIIYDGEDEIHPSTAPDYTRLNPFTLPNLNRNGVSDLDTTFFYYKLAIELLQSSKDYLEYLDHVLPLSPSVMAITTVGDSKRLFLEPGNFDQDDLVDALFLDPFLDIDDPEPSPAAPFHVATNILYLLFGGFEPLLNVLKDLLNQYLDHKQRECAQLEKQIQNMERVIEASSNIHTFFEEETSEPEASASSVATDTIVSFTRVIADLQPQHYSLLEDIEDIQKITSLLGNKDRSQDESDDLLHRYPDMWGFVADALQDGYRLNDSPFDLPFGFPDFIIQLSHGLRAPELRPSPDHFISVLKDKLSLFSHDRDMSPVFDRFTRDAVSVRNFSEELIKKAAEVKFISKLPDDIAPPSLNWNTAPETTARRLENSNVSPSPCKRPKVDN